MSHKDIEARRAYHREYQKKWREANLEKAKAIGAEYEMAHREQRRAQKRAHYDANAEKIRAKRAEKYDPVKQHAHYLANKDAINERNKAYRALNPELTKARNKAWHDANKERRHAEAKVYREMNKDVIDAKRKARHWLLKEEVWVNYGGAVCVCCGERHREFLTIDHIDGGGSKHRRELRKNGSQHIYQWLKRENYPSGYRVLCMNCNFAFGMYGHCPHHPTE